MMKEEQELYILGCAIGHSKSPVMYNTVYDACGLPWRYGSMDIPDESGARKFIMQASFLSINVTTPYKPLALEAAQESDAAARLAGGANLLVNMRAARALRDSDGLDGLRRTDETTAPCLFAHNVDGIGCISYLRREGVSVEGARIAVCGTGPTAMSITNAALSAGASVWLLSRDADRAHRAICAYASMSDRDAPNAGSALSGLFAGSYSEDADAVRCADVVIDATSLGMQEGDPAPFDTRLLHSGQVVFDTVYGHGVTRLIAAARDVGACALDGSGMLVGQAVATLGIVSGAAGVDLPLSRGELFELMSKSAGFDI